MCCSYLTRIIIVSLLLLVPNVQSYITILKPGDHGPVDDYDDNPHYDEGNTIHFEWDTDAINNVKVKVWQQYPIAGYQSGNATYYFRILLADGGQQQKLSWEAHPLQLNQDFSADDDVVMYYALYETDSEVYLAGCHYFNITRDKAAAKTSSVTRTSPTGTPQAGTDPQVTFSAASSPAPSPHDEMSCGSWAGIAAGATIGGIILLGGLGFFAGRQFQKAFSRAHGTNQEYTQTEIAEPPQAEDSKPLPTPEASMGQFESPTMYTVPPTIQEAPPQRYSYNPNALHEVA